MNNNLYNKKILFISPVFFNYHTNIIKQLQDKGAYVNFIPEVKDNILHKIIRRLNSKCLIGIYNRYYYKKIKKITNYDIFFLIKGFGLSSFIIEKIKNNNPNCKFYLYQWDSVKNFNYLYQIPLFTKVYSFDNHDCLEFGLDYLPLFYTKIYADLYETNATGCNIDVLFIGSVSDERVAFFNKIKQYFDERNIVLYCSLYCNYWKYIKYLFKKGKSPFLTTKKLSENQIVNLLKCSNSVIDLPSSSQNGLTMRSIETIGAGKMLITTNKNINKEDFYNPNQIKLIEMDNFSCITKELFSNGKYEAIPSYSLENWMVKILS